MELKTILSKFIYRIEPKPGEDPGAVAKVMIGFLAEKK